MNVFIDANILLDFYRLSGGDLEEIRKIAKLAENEEITLYISDVLQDEYERNREGTITQAVEQFRKSRVDLHLPNLVRAYDEAKALTALRSGFGEEMQNLLKRLDDDIKAQSLLADEVIAELFNSTDVAGVPSQIVEAGIMRSELARPPGKPGSNGDAIHWEWLLNKVPDGEDLLVISGDGDFESPAVSGAPSAYLASEWKKKKQGVLTLHKTLTEFLQEHFPDIKLADEIDKMAAISKFCQSSNFATTHSMVTKLSKFDDFTKDEINQLLDGYYSNSQINWILGDSDIREFAMKLVQHAYDADLEKEAFPLEEMLNELELNET